MVLIKTWAISAGAHTALIVALVFAVTGNSRTPSGDGEAMTITMASIQSPELVEESILQSAPQSLSFEPLAKIEPYHEPVRLADSREERATIDDEGAPSPQRAENAETGEARMSDIRLLASKVAFAEPQESASQHAIAIPERAARKIHTPAPSYPRSAQRMGTEGSVTLEFDVNERGECFNIVVRESSGSEVLDNAAVENVRDWRFEPAIKDDAYVVSRHEMKFTFRLEGGGSGN